MIVVCSEDLMNSKWCFAEITHARSLGKPMFPIKIAPCELNSILSDSQLVDFIKNDEKEAKIIDSEFRNSIVRPLLRQYLRAIAKPPLGE